MRATRGKHKIKAMEDFLRQLPSDTLVVSKDDKCFRPASPSLAELPETDVRPFTIRPKDDHEWLDILDEVDAMEEREGRPFRPHREGHKERYKITCEYFSEPDSFLFLNVGSFHRDVYDNDEILALLEKRLQEDAFRFIVTSSHAVMKDRDGRNPVLEAFLAHSDKGMVVDMGKRPPLHFIEVVSHRDGKVRRRMSFEYDHDEAQNLRDRYIVTAPRAISRLHRAQFIGILETGRIRTSISQFGTYRQ